jgi:apyrase
MWVHPHGVETTGALDLGGASTQISFVAEEVGLNTSDVVQVSLYGYTYTLYTHSFQCYGRNEAEKKFLAMLLQVPELGDGRCFFGGLSSGEGALPSRVRPFYSS